MLVKRSNLCARYGTYKTFDGREEPRVTPLETHRAVPCLNILEIVPFQHSISPRRLDSWSMTDVEIWSWTTFCWLVHKPGCSYTARSRLLGATSRLRRTRLWCWPRLLRHCCRLSVRPCLSWTHLAGNGTSFLSTSLLQCFLYINNHFNMNSTIKQSPWRYACNPRC